MTDALDLDAVGQAELVRRGEVSPTELVDAAIARIEARNPELNAVIHPRFEAARAEAAGELPDGPFRGVPFLVKDAVASMAGEPAHAGMGFLQRHGYRAPRDQWLVERATGLPASSSSAAPTSPSWRSCRPRNPPPTGPPATPTTSSGRRAEAPEARSPRWPTAGWPQPTGMTWAAPSGCRRRAAVWSA